MLSKKLHLFIYALSLSICISVLANFQSDKNRDIDVTSTKNTLEEEKESTEPSIIPCCDLEIPL